MKTYTRNTLKYTMAGALILTSACSKIEFSPAPGFATNTTASTETLPDGSVKDSFTFNQNGTKAKVDVLIIDDNSSSMQNKQVRLGSALGSFITSLGSIDWQIGITTTDTSDDPVTGLKGSLLQLTGAATNILTNAIPNYATVFANTVHRSEIGSSDERPIRAMMHAFGKRNAENAGFFRPSADLAVVVMSDEDEASDGIGVASDPANVPNDAINAFSSAFGNSKTMVVYGIIIAPGNTSCYNSESVHGASYGTQVNALVNQTGGVTGSICDLDFGPSLANIGDRVLSGVRTATLTQDPNVSTVQLQIVPADASLTWTITGRVISFNKPPVRGTTVQVVYHPK